MEWLWYGLSQTSIAYIDVRFFVHATENLEKVVEAVRHVLPSDYIDDIVFEKNSLRGHYGNSITLFETRIKERKIVSAFIENLSIRLDEIDKKTLIREIDLHVEKGSLYFRLDKQAAFQDKLKLRIDDPIHVRIRFRKTKIEDIVQTCRELGMIK